MKQNQVVYKCDNPKCDEQVIHYPDQIGSRAPAYISVVLSKNLGGSVSTYNEYHFCDLMCLKEWTQGMLENMIYDKIAEGAEEESGVAAGHNNLSGFEKIDQQLANSVANNPVRKAPHIPSRMNANKITPVGKVSIVTHKVKM